MKSVLLSRVSILLAAIVIIGVGCRKLDHSSNSTSVTVTQNDPEEPVPDAIGGKGGAATLRIVPNHDGLDIDSCKLYIKYNASVVPLDRVYDDSIWAKQIDGGPVATFEGLTPGNYYLFADGWDLIRSQNVRGGMPFIIPKENERTAFTFMLPIQDYTK